MRVGSERGEGVKVSKVRRMGQYSMSRGKSEGREGLVGGGGTEKAIEGNRGEGTEGKEQYIGEWNSEMRVA